MIYASALIILYGAEVSFTMMHPETYTSLKHVFEDERKVNMYYGLLILQSIYFKFESGEGNTQYSDLLKKTGNHSVDLDHFLKLFADKKLIINDKDGEYLPTNNSINIKLTDLFDLINEAKIIIPPARTRKNQGPGSITDIFDKLQKQRDKVLSQMSLKDLKI